MTYTTTEEFTVLHALKVRGVATAPPLASTAGISRGEVQKILDDAVARGLARSRSGGRLDGYMLTAAGHDRHAALREREVSAQERTLLAPAYESFLTPNREFKELVSSWQLSGAGDAAPVLPALAALHAQVTSTIALAAEVMDRFDVYRVRLDHAHARVAGGDTDALARPRSDSYHDVWMELHEDLLQTMGRERSAVDG